MIFFQLKTYGDFDIPITDSMWYKENPTSVELGFLKEGKLLDEMVKEFRKLSGEKFSMREGSMYCGREEQKVMQAFKDYLRARGYNCILPDIQIQFTDEGLLDGD